MTALKNGAITEAKLKELKPEIDNWKKKHGEIVQLTIDLDENEVFEGIFSIPSESDINLSTRKELSELEQQKQLSRLCVLYPDAIAFDGIITKYWGMAIPISSKLINLAHITKQATVKKL